MGGSQSLLNNAADLPWVADTLGAPVDLFNAGLGLAGVGVEHPVGGSQSIRDLMHSAGIGQTDDRYAPRSDPERYVQAAARGVGQSVIPGLGAPALGGRMGLLAGNAALRGGVVREAEFDAKIASVLADHEAALRSGDRYQELAGQNGREALLKLRASGFWSGIPRDGRRAAAQKAITDARAAARETLRSEFPRLCAAERPAIPAGYKLVDEPPLPLGFTLSPPPGFTVQAGVR